MIDEKKLIEAIINGEYTTGNILLDMELVQFVKDFPKIVTVDLKFPTMQEMAKDVAEKAMDEYEYKGKTIRQWIDEIQKYEWIPVSERLPDKHIVLCDVFYPAEDEDDEDFHNIKILNYVGDGEFRNPWGDIQNVVAWMELPESYEVTSNEQSNIGY